MRLVGAAERGMQLAVQRALSRRVFGKLIAEQGSFLLDIAKVFGFINHYITRGFISRPMDTTYAVIENPN